ncbi:MAG: PQQ-binding-like beta-propeller repeat protein [Propionibacteriaceae bacterium]|nr:PQQ-binding-like beta-propeller repeat protein [Propionibacteriaceae bacterium]
MVGRPASATVFDDSDWLPTDGTRYHFADGSLNLAVEWARIAQPVGLLSGPDAFRHWVDLAEVDVMNTAYARVAAVLTEAGGQSVDRRDDLWTITPSGARTAVEATPGGDLIMVPGRLDLPAGLAVGQSWTSDGDAFYLLPGEEWSGSPYHAAYASRPAADPSAAARGCLTIGMDFTIVGRPTVHSAHTWCPGEGVVGFTEAGHNWTHTPAPPAIAVASPAPFDWDTAEALDFQPATADDHRPDVTPIFPVSPPGLLADGRVVFSNLSSDVVALDLGEDPPLAAWRARPGGDVTSLATLGGITVATSTKRQAVAYGPNGQWLWRARLDDVVQVPPIQFQDMVLIATLDGGLIGLDLGTGAERWRATLAGEIRLAPVVVGDRVVVSDQRGVLSCFDAGGNKLWRANPGIANQIGVTTGAEPVVVVASAVEMAVLGLSVDDGRALWLERYTDVAISLIGLDDVVVLRARDRTTALDSATGATRWVWSGERTVGAAGGGHRVLLIGKKDLVLLDDTGSELTRWSIPRAIEVNDGALVFAAAKYDRVVAYVQDALIVGTTR